jgi:hypothetical protein
MRMFVGYRANPPERYQAEGFANPPDVAQYEGVEWDDGTVAVRWLTETRSSSTWSNFADFEHVHGHADYGTRIEWYAPGDTSDEYVRGVLVRIAANLGQQELWERTNPTPRRRGTKGLRPGPASCVVHAGQRGRRLRFGSEGADDFGLDLRERADRD